MQAEATSGPNLAHSTMRRRQQIDRHGRSAILQLDVTTAGGGAVHIERRIERLSRHDEEPMPMAAWLPHLDRLVVRVLAELEP